ncbi:hypothetical protein ACE1MK_15315 [Tenacibaculum maritimum]|uniref:hypothetical protein n=1 Tax=Tenacibaculum maritimum TaxID=107401 RepID=UPI0012E5932A|nr:hypothetical protein [Tenacibaculum maritimum]MCD9581767.1 hypothetical protein [Tenacibaculum maritimum]MCD9635941.1 hypothetical protein [Tenacibaculum maritimum]CAA0149566.1 conserved membrane hypothetical protein [Tenacibaculum maritimum]CAA0149650.1 conserved membrane hypothetical protein [Tenacibaculum maritimum]CAA0209098.1 conserved membrane hypothetical protein [Tenacibaculum maritimum]
MKRLRNTGIYYTIFGILLAISFVFFQLWRISILGIFLLLIYLILRFGFKKKEIATRLDRRQLQKLDFFLAIFPILYVILTLWYVWRPYKQSIILPKGYEGVVAIQYNKPNGLVKKWTGGFLGIGASRLIEVDSTGIAKTQFKFLNNAISFLGMKQSNQNDGGLKIYYENDLDNEIVKGADGVYYSYKNNNELGIYFTDFNYYPLMIFVIVKTKNYNKYFMTKDEIGNWKKNQEERYPQTYIEEPVHKLNKKYDYYNLIELPH